MRWRPDVLLLALEMQCKLSQNRFKDTQRPRDPDTPGWHGDKPSALFRRLREEVSEMEAAVLAGHPPAEILAEAADVCNFVMMLCDNAGCFEAPTPEEVRADG